MSFFDEDEEPTQAQPRTRRRSSATAGGGAGAPDSQTLLVRRAVAVGGAFLVLILLFIAVRGCMESQRKNSLKDYNRSVSSIVRESDQNVGVPFFELLSQGNGESAQDLQTTISGYRVTAEQQLSQAEKLDVPDELRAAQESVLIALEFRRDGLDAIAQRIRTALGDEGEAADEAIAQITAQMQGFLASDVIWQARVAPLIKKGLDDAEVGGQTVASTDGFLPDLSWLDEETVADRLGQRISQDGGTARGEPAPGLHGTGIQGVSAGDAALQAGVANRIPAGTDTFVVRFTNQGENDEADVRVVLRITGSGKAITAQRTVDSVAQGATAEASLRIDRQPAAGQAVTITAEVRRVPGEEKVDNNKLEFQAIFEQ